MEVSIGYGTINSYGDTSSGSFGNGSISCTFGIRVYIDNDLSIEDNEIVDKKLYKWFEEKILTNPKLIDSIKESIK